MGKTFRKDMDDYDEVRISESKKERKIRQRKRDYNETTPRGVQHGV